ncbi:hypothetical protein M409DRAFT_27122 [Zasmidium cellare ATCC 36951]|uniref:Xylanolytic transcriptional activator regulatory domain-containing protein n=1 Tax=Zasmidium cellare ATCC 36951 TaxID=1080233 RepID=A0A6A6CA21_ZASCE|nr:uncharacterized protein M409DRAFT_27122 [Zasmidium cellare ATCC 36951]KAF2162499.1 hypothetical protein M409DRAFT_27122 [Zasmidium cellare ATCC 36951]
MAAFVASDTASAMYKLVAEAMHSDNSADIFTEKPASATLVYLMAAASIYYSGDQACPDPSVPHLVDAAVRGMRMITFGVEPYRMAQCLAMFTCLSTFHPAYGSTWYLVGLLAVECLSLGVHSYEQQSIMPQKERLEMNRFFWAVFIMDR